jgi:hypothetical protein
LWKVWSHFCGKFNLFGNWSAPAYKQFPEANVIDISGTIPPAAQTLEIICWFYNSNDSSQQA